MEWCPSLEVRHVHLGPIANQREDALELGRGSGVVEGGASVFVPGVHMATLADHQLQTVQVAMEERLG